MRKPKSVQGLTDLGRVRLSKSFFMRDFLFSDIAAIHGLSNVPDDPDLAIATGTRLCEDLLEPLQVVFGRIAIRSAYRSAEVNGLGNAMMLTGKGGYNCASNADNAGGHIWDLKGGRGQDRCYGLHRRAVVLGCVPGAGRLAEVGVVDSRPSAIFKPVFSPEVLGVQHYVERPASSKDCQLSCTHRHSYQARNGQQYRQSRDIVGRDRGSGKRPTQPACHRSPGGC